MMGKTISQTTYTGSTDAEKDASCCQQCKQEATCEFWVRSTVGNECWLKYDFTGYANNTERRGKLIKRT